MQLYTEVLEFQTSGQFLRRLLHFCSRSKGKSAHAHTHTHVSGEISHNNSLSLKSVLRRIVITTAKSNYQFRQVPPSVRMKYNYFRRKYFRAIMFGFLMKTGRYIPISVTIGQESDRPLKTQAPTAFETSRTINPVKQRHNPN